MTVARNRRVDVRRVKVICKCTLQTVMSMYMRSGHFAGG